MEEIRSRIEEIRGLAEGKGLSISAKEGAAIKTGSPAESSPDAAEFTMLLQEAAGLIESQDADGDSSLSQSLLGTLLGGGESGGTLSGMGLTGLDSIRALLDKTGAEESSSSLDEGLLARAIDAYRKQSE
jgi:hypothetical protein